MPPRCPKTGPLKELAIRKVLLDAIQQLKEDDLRLELEKLCHEFPDANAFLQGRLLVQGKKVVQYHADKESEDEGFPSGSESDASDLVEEVVKRGGVVIGDEDFTPKRTECENCKEEFCVDENERGDCVWHPGEKELLDEADIWQELEAHWGHPRDYGDDDYYSIGFKWTCCEKEGKDEGCKVTKHKSKSNRAAIVSADRTRPSRKRKAEEALPKATKKKGGKGLSMFDVKVSWDDKKKN